MFITHSNSVCSLTILFVGHHSVLMPEFTKIAKSRLWSCCLVLGVLVPCGEDHPGGGDLGGDDLGGDDLGGGHAGGYNWQLVHAVLCSSRYTKMQ